MNDSPRAPAAPPPALLAQITADLAAGDDLRSLLDRFLHPLVRMADACAGSVRMLSPDGERFELVSTLGLPEGLRETEQLVDRHCGFCARGLDEARVVWVGELRSCAARTHDAFFGGTCKAAVSVPLCNGGRVLGIYNLFFAHRNEPGPAVLGLLRSVGDLLGLALAKHRLEQDNLRAAVATERQMMAAEVHDAVAQDLTFAKLRLPLLRDAIEACDRERALAYLEEIRETLGQAHGSLREVITHFRTGVDPRGLGAALAALGARFTLRTGIPLEVENRLPALRLPPAAEAEVFHIVQEALANVERHAHAHRGWVALQPGRGRIEIRIEDDGVGPEGGIAEAAGPAHYGLQIMRERAQRLAGELTVGPRAGGGTLVRCSLPLPAEGGDIA